MTASAATARELDVRGMRKPDKHPTIFAAYDALSVNDSFILVNDHDPKHLHEEFIIEHPGSFTWEYLSEQPRDWRIRITKLTAASLPRVLVDTTAFRPESTEGVHAAWALPPRDRDLDANVITLGPGARIDAHAGPELDVLLHVISGAGHVVTETGSVDLTPGQLVWLPRRSQRRFDAGPSGLCYLTVHQRRQALVISPSRPSAPTVEVG